MNPVATREAGVAIIAADMVIDVGRGAARLDQRVADGRARLAR